MYLKEQAEHELMICCCVPVSEKRNMHHDETSMRGYHLLPDMDWVIEGRYVFSCQNRFIFSPNGLCFLLFSPNGLCFSFFSSHSFPPLPPVFVGDIKPYLVHD